MNPVDIEFASDVARLAGTCLDPVGGAARACVVLLGGAISATRDGDTGLPEPPKRDAIKRLAEHLAGAGYSSLRFDKPGHGASRPKPAWRGSYRDETTNAVAAISTARARYATLPLIVMGESAGAYLACLTAARDVRADAYVFLGPFCGKTDELYVYNFGRLADYAASSGERRTWAESAAPRDLALGLHYREMLAAARRGDATFTIPNTTLHAPLQDLPGDSADGPSLPDPGPGYSIDSPEPDVAARLRRVLRPTRPPPHPGESEGRTLNSPPVAHPVLPVSSEHERERSDEESRPRSVVDGLGSERTAASSTGITLPLERRREELRDPPDEMFRCIQTPTLIVSGACDLNVPPAHGARCAAILRSAGVADVTHVEIPEADHSFQKVPYDEDVRFRERYTFDSFLRPYDPRLYDQILRWLAARFGEGSD